MILEYAKSQTESVLEALLLLAAPSRLESCYFEGWGENCHQHSHLTTDAVTNNHPVRPEELIGTIMASLV